MISLEEIDKAIIDLESKDTSYAVVERLAWLYTVRDHLKPTEIKYTEVIDGNEFCEACSNVPYTHLMSVLSEHFECIKALYPREYRALLNKISDKNE